jgi:hypothetical protein
VRPRILAASGGFGRLGFLFGCIEISKIMPQNQREHHWPATSHAEMLSLPEQFIDAAGAPDAKLLWR